MQIECPTIQFTIVIDFPDSDVDMVLNEISHGSIVPPMLMNGGRSYPVDKAKLSKTPTARSVDFCLAWVSGYVNTKEMEIVRHKWLNTHLDGLGIKVVSTYGLMQGCCHFVCECDYDKFSPALVRRVKDYAEDIFESNLKYHS